MNNQLHTKHWTGYSKNDFKRLVNAENKCFLDQIPNLQISENPQPSSSNITDSVLGEYAFQFDALSDSSEINWEEGLSDMSDALGISLNETERHSSESSKSNTKKRSLAMDLASFVVKKARPTRDTTELLHILNDHGMEGLPKTRNTLVKAPKGKIDLRPLSGVGSFFYRGIRAALEQRKHLLIQLDHIEIDIGIDGARIFKSSRTELWPCIASITNAMNLRPFLIGT